MAQDFTLIAEVGASALFIALIVWLMYKKAIEPEWAEISSDARASRRKKEREQ